MGYSLKDIPHASTGKGAILMANPHTGLHVQFKLCECILPDACLNSLQGKEYGKEFIHKNAHFLTDYFYHQYREKDFI